MAKQEQEFEELIESFINGNRNYVESKILSWRKKKIIQFFFFLENNRDWVCPEDVIFDLVNALHNRVLT